MTTPEAAAMGSRSRPGEWGGTARLDAPASPPAATPAASRGAPGPRRAAGPRRRWWGPILAASALAALYVWDDLVLAGPIVVATATIGTAGTFVVFTLLYGAGSLVLALLAVRAYDRWSDGRESRLASWLARQQAGRRSDWGRRLLASGRVLGFVAASFLLGGITTTWLVRYAGRREGIAGVAIASCAIFAVTFVGFYSGLAHLVLNL